MVEKDVAYYEKQYGSLLRNELNLVALSAIPDEETRNDVVQSVASGLKTGALFFGGRAGKIASITLFSADEIKDDMAYNAAPIDGAMGALKGDYTHDLFRSVGKSSTNLAGKALWLTLGARGIDVLLSRSTYCDSSGNLAPITGIKETAAEQLNSKTIGIDLLTFGLSLGALKSAEALGGLSLKNASALTSNAFTGASFGLMKGAQDEMQFQIRSGHFDANEMSRRAMTSAAVNLVAAIPGHLRVPNLKMSS